MKSVVVRIVRSDGQEMTLGTGTPWRIPNDGLEGFADLDYSVSTSANVLTDGSSYIGKRVEERDRTISADYWGTDQDAARAQAIAFFNPRFSFEAHVTYRGQTRWCEGEQTGFKCEPNKTYQMVSITWTLLCQNPFMQSEDGNEARLTDEVPMFGFPFVDHPRKPMPDGKKYPVGFVASRELFEGQNTVYNAGDMPARYRIHCDFSGSVKNPRFSKDNKFVQVNRAFVDGDALDIDFTQTPPKVLVNCSNAIQLCTRDSSFIGMEMQVGENHFTYTADDPATRGYMSVQVLYHKQYLGV